MLKRVNCLPFDRKPFPSKERVPVSRSISVSILSSGPDRSRSWERELMVWLDGTREVPSVEEAVFGEVRGSRERTEREEGRRKVGGGRGTGRGN